jgi:hypothetical protein
MDAGSKNYFERRAEQERIASENAADARAAQSHRELADHYRSLAEGGELPEACQDSQGEPSTMPKDFLIVP